MTVRLLTFEQKESLSNQMYMQDSFFNPIEDANGNWIISNEEVENCNCKEFEWISELPEIEFNPKELIIEL